MMVLRFFKNKDERKHSISRALFALEKKRFIFSPHFLNLNTDPMLLNL